MAQSGQTPLHLATTLTAAQEELAKIMRPGYRGSLTVDQYVNQRDDEGRTPFHEAVRNGRNRIASFLYESFPVDIRTTDVYGRTPLHDVQDVNLASHILGNWEPIQYSERLNKQDNAGYTPLMRAIESGRITVAEFLLEKGAALTLEGRDGKTAQILAEERGLPIASNDDISYENTLGGEVDGPEVPEPEALAAPLPVLSSSLANSGSVTVPAGKEDPVSLRPIKNGNVLVNWGNSAPPPAGTGTYYHANTYNGIVTSGDMRSPLTRKPIVAPKKYTARVKGGKRNQKRSRGRKHGRSRGRKSSRRS